MVGFVLPIRPKRATIPYFPCMSSTYFSVIAAVVLSSSSFLCRSAFLAWFNCLALFLFHVVKLRPNVLKHLLHICAVLFSFDGHLSMDVLREWDGRLVCVHDLHFNAF